MEVAVSSNNSVQVFGDEGLFNLPDRFGQGFEIFCRAAHCGKTTRQLTLDHVIPRYRGGPHTWENLVSACTPCNRRKAGKTPDEANMQLRNRPTTPRAGRYSYIPAQHLQAREEWRRYLPQ